MVSLTQEQGIYVLVENARQGCRSSIDQLIRLVQPRLEARLNAATGNKELTGDLVQETLLSMICSIGKLRKVESFWPWLLRIAKSKIQQHYRHQGRVKEQPFSSLDSYWLDPYLSVCSSPSEIMIRRERQYNVIVATRCLSRRTQKILELRYRDQLNYTRIAALLGCSAASARSESYRARRKIQAQLQKQT